MKHIKFLKISIIDHLICFVVYFIAGLHNAGGTYHPILYLVFLLLLFPIPLSIPAWVIHYSYYLHDKGKQAFINTSGDLIIKNSSGAEMSFNVSKIEEYRRNFKNEQFFSFLSWVDYYYYKFYDASGKSVTVTCLIGDDLDLPFTPLIVNTKFPKLPKDSAKTNL